MMRVLLFAVVLLIVPAAFARPSVRSVRATASPKPVAAFTESEASNYLAKSVDDVDSATVFHVDLHNHEYGHDAHEKGRGCGTVDYNKKLDELYPERGTDEQFETTMLRLLEERRRGLHAERALSYPVTINVVVHVIYDGEALGTASNIGSTQINSQFTVLNQDYLKTTGTPGDGTGVDTQISFRLAQTKRWNRNDYAQWGAPPYSVDTIDTYIKPQTIVNPTQFMNVWVLDLADSLLGYAQFPSASGLAGLNTNGGAANTDGVVILYKAFGNTGNVVAPYDGGRTATHEVGHFLGLRHIWGDGTTCSATDYCDDTPPCDKPNYVCTPNTDCSTTTPCQIKNYMDYTPDACMDLFTQDQTNRMHVVLETSPRRTGIIVAANVSYAASISVVTPEDGYVCDTSVPLYVNLSVSNTGYTSISTIGYSILLDGTSLITGTADVGTLSTGQVAYFPASQPVGLEATAEGFHTLTAVIDSVDSNPNGNNETGNYEVVLYVLQNPATSTAEDFEGITVFPPANWALINPQGWSAYSNVPQAGGSTGISAVSPFYTLKQNGQNYVLFYVPGIYIGSEGLTVSFDVSYALYTNGTFTQYGESLEVVLSPLCGGAADDVIFSKNGADLATVSPTGASWVPTGASDWRHESVQASSSLKGNVVTVGFRTTGYYGNNLWLDNIVISAGSSAASTLNGWTSLLQ